MHVHCEQDGWDHADPLEEVTHWLADCAVCSRVGGGGHVCSRWCHRVEL